MILTEKVIVRINESNYAHYLEMGYDPVIFYYEDVQSYYEFIQNFRDLFWTGSNFDFTHLNLP